MARLELTGGLGEGVICTAVLSRRNLLSLLTKLDGRPRAGNRTLENNDCWRDGQPVDDILLVLIAEDDAEHYSRRPDPPGPMRPETESFLARYAGYTRGPQG